PYERAADAEAQHHEFLDAQVVHHAELVVGIRVPRPLELEGPGGLAAGGVAQVGRHAAILVFELLHRIERRAVGVPSDGRVESPAGDEQQRQAGAAGVFVVDAYVAFFVERHGFPFPSLLVAPWMRRRQAVAARWPFRNVRTCRTARGIFSLSPHDALPLSSDFGASIADSMAMT